MQSPLAPYTIHHIPATKNPAVLKAEKFDQAGDHAMALQTLKDALQGNDLEAATRLGKRLFAGDRAPQYFKEGVNLLQFAAQRGNGEALCQVACLHAIGVLRQSWQTAVDLLVKSARAQWRSAQGQLLALSTDEKLRQSVLAGRQDDLVWQQLAETIDLEFWLGRAETHSLSGSPEIKTISGFIPAAMCEWLVEIARPNLARAEVYDAYNKVDTVSETRTNRAMSFDFMMSDVSTLLTQAHISASLSIPVSRMEPITVLHYATGEEITPHYDFIHPDSTDFHQQVEQHGQRCVTFIIYLNQEYEGGETTFPKLDIITRGKRGDAIYFVNITDGSQPNLDTLHTGSPPTSGEKWIVTQFIREKNVINIQI